MPSVLGIAGLSLAAVLVPTYAAQATPRAVAPASVGTLVIDPTEALPGAVVAATVSIDEAASCTVEAVTIQGTYVDVNGDDATTSVVPTTKQDSLTYTANLTIPADAARSDLSEEPVSYEATAACDTVTETASPTPSATVPAGLKRAAAVKAVVATTPTPAGSATVTVLATTAPTVTVNPDTVHTGKSFTFTITGCTGGLADLYFLDGDDNDTTVPDANVTQDSATAYHGTFTVATNAALGDGGIVVDCAQAASSGAGVRIVDDSTDGSGSGDPIAVPVGSTPHFTG